nr:spore coat protein GerQ [Ammoniphilus resinae]
MPAYPPMQQQQPQQQPQQVFPPQPSGAYIPGTPGASQGVQVPGMLPIEQSYIENILRLNKGKSGTFYFTYENNNEWNAKVYKGVVEAAGRDHIILSEPSTGKRYLLLMVNFDYAEFDEPLNYEYPFGSAPRPIRPR